MLAGLVSSPSGGNSNSLDSSSKASVGCASAWARRDGVGALRAGFCTTLRGSATGTCATGFCGIGGSGSSKSSASSNGITSRSSSGSGAGGTFNRAWACARVTGGSGRRSAGARVSGGSGRSSVVTRRLATGGSTHSSTGRWSGSGAVTRPLSRRVLTISAILARIRSPPGITSSAYSSPSSSSITGSGRRISDGMRDRKPPRSACASRGTIAIGSNWSSSSASARASRRATYRSCITRRPDTPPRAASPVSLRMDS